VATLAATGAGRDFSGRLEHGLGRNHARIVAQREPRRLKGKTGFQQRGR
jgi:hypothetical protein